MAGESVAVAMSGGVDSSVAALLLQQQGYDVSALYMKLHPEPGSGDGLTATCQRLGIPLYELDFREAFQGQVVDYFCRGYSLGQTPNPCVVCNQRLKFGLLLERALAMGASRLATGHYARIERTAGGYRLLQSADRRKDQSYFLYTLGQGQLGRVLFPLGMLTKERVRGLAAGAGLPVSRRRESQDICFIPDGDYRSFIRQRVALLGGDIVDIEGNVLSRHGGLALYTVGQRHGLGLASAGELYVLRLEADSNRVVVGSREQLTSGGLVAGDLSWVSGRPPAGRLSVRARVRYKAPLVAAELHPEGATARVYFRQPQAAITPGQSVVFYGDGSVLGGGIIATVLR